MIRPVAFSVAVLLGVPAWGQAGDSAGEAVASASLPDCPPRIRVLGQPPGAPFDCLCTPEVRNVPGTEKLYGSGPYDSVSNICIAAVHAGVTPLEGGPVRVIPRPPETSFTGSTANGIVSQDWGSSLFNTFDVAPAGN